MTCEPTSDPVDGRALAAPEVDPEKAIRPVGAPPAARAKLDAFGIDAVCKLITDGVGIRGIAAEAGVSTGSVLTWLERDPEHSARVREARRLTAWHWDEEAERAIKDAAPEPAELMRARELAFHYRWRAGK